MEAQRKERGFDPRPCEKAVIKRWKSAVRAALEDAPFESAWKRGRLLDWHDAIELARR